MLTSETIDLVIRKLDHFDVNGWPVYDETLTTVRGALFASLETEGEPGVAIGDVYFAGEQISLTIVDEMVLRGDRWQIEACHLWQRSPNNIAGSRVRVRKDLIDMCHVTRSTAVVLDDLGTATHTWNTISTNVACLVHTDTASVVNTESAGEPIAPATYRVTFTHHGLRVGDRLFLDTCHDGLLTGKTLVVTGILSARTVVVVRNDA
ncbi:MAG: DUF6093 family protein [Propionibacteriaceae bacterium]|jgi:hypothetical protein|nr:DUF6093 family protein [Propionibacteriaceae bacterium]